MQLAKRLGNRLRLSEQRLGSLFVTTGAVFERRVDSEGFNERSALVEVGDFGFI